MNDLQTRTAPTAWVRIFMSGPIEVAKQTIRADVLVDGLCVTVEPTHFIYTGGEEAGYVVGLLNYPRFPTTQAELDARAQRLALRLLADTHQHSVLLMNPAETRWMTRRRDGR